MARHHAEGARTQTTTFATGAIHPLLHQGGLGGAFGGISTANGLDFR